jgi:AraC-like DNA-binding protein
MANIGRECWHVEVKFSVKIQNEHLHSPTHFLIKWQMLLAGARLKTAREKISVILPSLGYESGSVFSADFRG